MRLPFVPALLLAIAGCAPTTRPAAPRAPAAPAVISLGATTPRDWRDLPQTLGTWTYAQDQRGSVAMFGEPGRDALAVLRCDARLHRLFLSRAGGGAGPFTIVTSSTTRQLPTGATGGTPPYHAALIPAADPLLDAMTFSRGRFVLDEPGAAPLALPAWAEIGRVIEDCRGATAPGETAP